MKESRLHLWRAYLHEAADNLRRGGWVTVSAIVTMTFALVIIGLFFLLSVNLEQMLVDIRSKSLVIVYLEERVGPQQQEALLTQVRALPGVKQVTPVSKEENLRRFRESLGENRDILGALDGNPLPASLELQVSEDEHFDVPALAAQLSVLDGVEEVNYGSEVLETIKQLATGIRLVILILGTVFGLAALFIITSTIKITVLARRDEVEVMRLVGATDWYIRWPYFLEGLLQGLVAALLAMALLYGVYRVLLWKFAVLPFLPVALTFFSLTLCGQLVLIGAAIGGGGALFALRHVLREECAE